MMKDTALHVIREAQSSDRITATLISTWARDNGSGYRVRLSLQKGLRQVAINSLADWYVVQHLWRLI